MSSSRKRPSEEEKAAAEKRRPRGTQPQRLHYGLINQGATCYLNSVLQVLFMTTEMHDRLDPKSKTTDRRLRNLFENLKETTGRTEKITETLRIDNVHQQRDAAEVLELILHQISPQASEVFQGELTYTTKCSRGHIINEETNPFWTLPLSLKDTQDPTYSVEGGFEKIFQMKTFSGDNMVYCNDCEKKRDATSGCEMGEFPQNLILLLKRFDFDYNTMSHVKSHCCVDVPCELRTKNKMYKLYGMVNHMGGLGGGHYTATILSDEDNKWYEFNDAHVEKVNKQPFAKAPTYSSSTAYLLLYRASRCPTDEMNEPHDEIRYLDEQRGQKRIRGSVGDKENRRLQESRVQTRKEKHKEAHKHQFRGEEGDRGHEKRFSGFTMDTAEDFFIPKKQNKTSYSMKQHPGSWTKPDKRKKQEEDVDSSRCSKISSILRKPLVIFIIIFCLAIIVILPVVLTSVKSTSTSTQSMHP